MKSFGQTSTFQLIYKNNIFLAHPFKKLENLNRSDPFYPYFMQTRIWIKKQLQ